MRSCPVPGPRYPIGARVRMRAQHEQGHRAGEVREAVLTYAYGIMFDGSNEIHRWYIESELEPETTNISANPTDSSSMGGVIGGAIVKDKPRASNDTQGSYRRRMVYIIAGLVTAGAAAVFIYQTLKRKYTAGAPPTLPGQPSLPAPTGLKSEVQGNTVILSWSPVPGASRYEVEVYDAAGNRVAWEQTTLTRSELQVPPTARTWRVRACA